MRHLRPLAAVAVLTCLACAGRRARDEPPKPDASGWVSPRLRDHPLAGKIWDVRKGAFVDWKALETAAAAAPYLLLGETHDNPDHHLVQARLVRAVTASGRRPPVAFEMLDVDQQPVVDAALRDGASATDLARAVKWDESGWPAFGLYRPVFEAALAARLPIVAANLPRRVAHGMVRKGASSLTPSVKERIERVGPFPPEVMKGLREDMAASHCGELPERMVEPMVLAQKAKDAQFAERMEASDGGDGAILVAGRGHVRDDVGVPLFLAKGAAPRPALAVGISEVSEGRARPEDYGAEYGGKLPFDYLVFTPGIEREDPCAGLREHQAKQREKQGERKEPEGTAL
jgi:uncharacterized iron-regulated protein